MIYTLINLKTNQEVAFSSELTWLMKQREVINEEWPFIIELKKGYVGFEELISSSGNWMIKRS